jgi:hypothetical protein
MLSVRLHYLGNIQYRTGFAIPNPPEGTMNTQTEQQTEIIPTTNSAPAERKPYETPTLETHGIMTQIVGQSIGGPL